MCICSFYAGLVLSVHGWFEGILRVVRVRMCGALLFSCLVVKTFFQVDAESELAGLRVLLWAREASMVMVLQNTVA